MEPEDQYPPLPPLYSLSVPEPQPEAAPERDPVWTGRDIAAVLIFTLGCLLAAMVTVGLIWLIARASSRMPAPTGERQQVYLLLLAQSIAFAAGMLFAAGWLRTHYRVRFWQAIHWRRLTASHALAVVGGAVALAVGGMALTPFLHVPHQLPVDRMFSPQTAWPMAIYGVALAPLFEEFFFRGLLYPSLRRSFTEGMSLEEARRWRPWFWLGATVLALGALLAIATRHLQGLPMPTATTWWLLAAMVLAAGVPLWTRGLSLIVSLLARLRQPELLAILVTGVLFGLMHSEQLAGAWGPLLLLSLVGIVLTAVRAYTGSLTASWLLHLSYNAVLFIALYYQSQGFHNFHGLHS